MTSRAFKYSVRLPFEAGPVNPERIAVKFLATLDDLTQIDSNVFPDWEVGDLHAMRGYPLAAVRSRVGEIIGRNVIRPPKEKPDYSAVAQTTIKARSHRMTFSADHGGIYDGNLWLKAGDEMVAPDPSVVTYPLFRAALLAINAIWQRSWACAQAFRVDYDEVPLYPGAARFPYSRFHVPWIAYLGPSLLKDNIISPDIKIEHTPDGGLLMTATEERLDPTNPEHLHRARILAETMIARTGHSS
jgi:hypothetical protein